jgi:hypothetical protein
VSIPLHGLNVQTLELAFQFVQFGLDGLIGADQLPALGIEARDLAIQEFLNLAAERCFERGTWVSFRVTPRAAGSKSKGMRISPWDWLSPPCGHKKPAERPVK